MNLTGREHTNALHAAPPAVPQNQKAIPEHDRLFPAGRLHESFDEDAKKVAEACNIVLTAGDMGTGQRVPLAGVPYHAVETYLSRLIQAGHKVAVEQTGTPERVEGVPGRVLETREVVRVVSHRPRSINAPTHQQECSKDALGQSGSTHSVVA